MFDWYKAINRYFKKVVCNKAENRISLQNTPKLINIIFPKTNRKSIVSYGKFTVQE